MFYITLSIISIVVFVFTMTTANRSIKRFVIPLFYAFTGLNYIAEYFILVIGKAYQYKPNIFSNAYFDCVFGSNISQLFVVPTTGLVLAVNQLKYRWSLISAFILCAIEWIFVSKKIFKHYWWTIVYTFVGLQLFYALAKYWRKMLIDEDSNLYKLFTVLLTIFVTYTSLIFYHIALLKTALFTVNWFNNRIRSHVAVATIYTALYSIAMFFSLTYRKWLLNIGTIVLLCILELILIKYKVLTVYNRLGFHLASPVTKLISLLFGNYVYQILFHTTKPKQQKADG